MTRAFVAVALLAVVVAFEEPKREPCPLLATPSHVHLLVDDTDTIVCLVVPPGFVQHVTIPMSPSPFLVHHSWIDRAGKTSVEVDVEPLGPREWREPLRDDAEQLRRTYRDRPNYVEQGFAEIRIDGRLAYRIDVKCPTGQLLRFLLVAVGKTVVRLTLGGEDAEKLDRLASDLIASLRFS